MFLDSQSVKKFVGLGHDNKPLPDDRMCISAWTLTAGSSHFTAVEDDRALLPSRQPCYCVEQGSFPVAVQADEANAFARPNHQVKIMNNAQRTVASRQSVDVENFAHRQSAYIFEICGTDGRAVDNFVEPPSRDNFPRVHHYD